MDYSGIPFVFHPAPRVSTPLALIGGFTPKAEATPQTYQRSEVTKMAVWDWYQASFVADPESVVALICSELNCISEPVKPQPPYLYGVAFHPLDVRSGKIDARHTLLTLHYGGINDRVLLRATSDEAKELAPFIRKNWPDHQVSRADMAVDFDEAGIFDELSGWLLDYAKANRIKTGFAGDWANGTQGRTLYVGSRQSAVYVRLYEKGHEQASKGSKHASLDWVRFEAEIKPQTKEARARLATIAAHQCFGVSRLTRAFAEHFGGRYDAIKVGKGKAEKSENPLRHLALQYGDILTEYLESEVADKPADQVLSDLLAMIQLEKAAKKDISKRLSVRKDWAKGSLWNAAQVPVLPLARLPLRTIPVPILGLKFRPVCIASGQR